MIKIIHYCWFGGKELPAKVKKCIKTWKKLLPDYEIKEWNENNFDINSCDFVKDAYESKKWAFVSDYCRIQALYNEGGLYLDTDVKILKDPSKIIDQKVFFGTEDSGFLGTAVIGTNEVHNKFMKEILDYYKEIGHFYPESSYSYANPVIISKLLKKHKVVETKNNIKEYDNGVIVYPREYFYPISYNYAEKNYTENTYMVHLFHATWTSRGERRTNFNNRVFGLKFGGFLNSCVNFVGNCKYNILHTLRSWLNSIELQYSIYFHRNRRLRKMQEELKNQSADYLAICHPEWIGVKNATKETFQDNILEVREQYNKFEAHKIAELIVNAGKKMVVFNAFARGWELIIDALKEIKPDIKIKLLIHGSNALFSEDYDWDVFNRMLDLYDKEKIDEISFVKKSLYEFYKAKEYKTSFLMNDVVIDNKEKYMPKEKINDGKIRVGLYASGDRWVKNTYNQISAISLLNNAMLDCIPINQKISTMARRYNLFLSGESNNVPREELYKRLARNNINVYVTFTECAPLIPLESMELGTLCITGNNHHYFEGTELEKYLVVDKPDDIMAIYEKINFALENEDKIWKLYKEWKKDYSEKVRKNKEEFLKI